MKSENKKEGMDFLEWSRVIDEINSVLRGSELTMRINRVFLAAAVAEREKFPAPKEPKNSITG